MDMFFDIIRIMGRDYPEMFNFLIILALIIVAIIILYIIHWWKKRTGQWITTMNHLIKDETWVGKRVIHAAMSREELDRAIGEFVEMYSTEEKSVQHPTVTQDAEGYTLTLPSTIGYNLFCYWVNHLVYFDEKKRFNKQVTAWYEVPEDAEGAWKPFAGKTLQLKLALMGNGDGFPVALGVIRDVEAPTYDDCVTAQIEEVKAAKKYHNFAELLETNDIWEVK